MYKVYSAGKPKGNVGPAEGLAQNGNDKKSTEEISRPELRISTAPKPPSEPMKRVSSGPQGKQGNRIQGAKVPIQQGPYPPPPQQFGMPYGQQPYQVQGGYPSYMQPAGQVFYPGNFRQPGNYYGQGVVSPMAGQDMVTSPHAVQSGSTAFSQPANTTPPVRQKRILRIEDPNTHEALDLKEISSRTQAKVVPEAGEEPSKPEETSEAKITATEAIEKSEEMILESTEANKVEQAGGTNEPEAEAENDTSSAAQEVRTFEHRTNAAIKPACMLILVV